MKAWRCYACGIPLEPSLAKFRVPVLYGDMAVMLCVVCSRKWAACPISCKPKRNWHYEFGPGAIGRLENA